MRPGYNARGKQNRMVIPRTESRAHRNPRRSGSCGPSHYCLRPVPPLTVTGARIARLSITGSFSLLPPATFTHCCMGGELAGGRESGLCDGREYVARSAQEVIVKNTILTSTSSVINSSTNLQLKVAVFVHVMRVLSVKSQAGPNLIRSRKEQRHCDCHN